MTGVFFAAMATLQPLLLGLVGWAWSGWALCAASVSCWVLAGLVVSPADVRLRSQIRVGLTSAPRTFVASAGAAAALAVVWTAYTSLNPFLGGDAETYHLAEPAMWMRGGRPDSMVLTHVGLPVQAYPKGAEVLFAWFIAMARTPVVLAPVMVGFGLLLVAAAYFGLRLWGATPLASGLGALTLMLLPVSWEEIAAPGNDMVTLVWLVVAAALCVGASTEPKLGWVALLATGLSVGTKTTTVLLALSMIVVTAFHLRRRMVTSRPLVLTGLVGVALGAGWPVRDLIVYGAPFYPFSNLPFGPPVPAVIRTFGASFLSNPSGAIRVAGVSGYVDTAGGGLVLLAALVPLGAWAVVHVARRKGRPAPTTTTAVAVLALVGVAVVELLLWGASPFTGWSRHPGTESLVAGGVRYLLPGFAPAAAALALVSRVPSLRPWSLTGLAAAVGLDMWRIVHLGYPYRPTTLTIAAALVVGGLLGLGIGAASRRHRSVPRIPALGWALIPLALLALVIPERSFLARHIAVSAATKVDQTAILTWIRKEPGWARGHSPVAIGPDADVTFMGPNFQHPMEVVDADTRCSTVRQAAAKGWLILTQVPNGGVFEVPYPAAYCMAGTVPAFRSGLTYVYAPAAFLNPGS